MVSDEELAYADRVGRFYAREYGFPPIAGRVLGYVMTCSRERSTIGQLSEDLKASRTAVTNAVRLLEDHHALMRSRPAGEQADYVTIDPRILEPDGFTAAVYREHAALARDGLAFLGDHDSPRRATLQEAMELYEFLAEKLPAVLDEWRRQRRRP
ncbi:GbsR/MarR family transcriptional regulator [Streptosporangium sp. CA-115845]|uniref:GbsR/MarR family transcriptional regulator n=1 Tax=Streptosporangium sp. CA-115845 TaxID=3240071 RepID=UPI003D90B395